MLLAYSFACLIVLCIVAMFAYPGFFCLFTCLLDFGLLIEFGLDVIAICYFSLFGGTSTFAIVVLWFGLLCWLLTVFR